MQRLGKRRPVPPTVKRWIVLLDRVGHTPHEEALKPADHVDLPSKGRGGDLGPFDRHRRGSAPAPGARGVRPDTGDETGRAGGYPQA